MRFIWKTFFFFNNCFWKKALIFLHSDKKGSNFVCNCFSLIDFYVPTPVVAGPEAELRDNVGGGSDSGEELLPDERPADGAAAAAAARDGRNTVPGPGHLRSAQ